MVTWKKKEKHTVGMHDELQYSGEHCTEMTNTAHCALLKMSHPLLDFSCLINY